MEFFSVGDLGGELHAFGFMLIWEEEVVRLMSLTDERCKYTYIHCFLWKLVERFRKTKTISCATIQYHVEKDVFTNGTSK